MHTRPWSTPYLTTVVMADMPILAIHSGEALLHFPLNYAESWRGVSKRHGSVSSSGSGGKASGGSVKNPCSRRRAVSRVVTDSGTSGNGLTGPESGGSKLALQRKWGEQLLYVDLWCASTIPCPRWPS